MHLFCHRQLHYDDDVVDDEVLAVVTQAAEALCGLCQNITACVICCNHEGALFVA